MMQSTKPSTPSGLAVIAVCASPLLIVLGLAGLAYGHFAPPEKRELALALTYYGGLSLGIGVFIAIAFWVVRRFSD
jgi:hypothetical protein